MNDLEILLEKLTSDDSLIRIIFSAQRKKSQLYSKAALRPVMLKGSRFIQAEYHTRNKVTHRNLTPGEAAREAWRLASEEFKQIAIFTGEADYQVLAAKADNPRILKSAPSMKAPALSHDQAKNYIIPDGEPCDFLIRLGVMDPKGKVYKKYYAKFRQINRFLEIVEDAVQALPQGRELNIVDFGCGKAYLTFALYYYLRLKKNLPVRLTGLDLKEDVIKFCNDIARELHYDALHFELGDISRFESDTRADMVVTLHACDTATDFALIKAVGWGASVILSVPCCQHELFDQIQNNQLGGILKHGILKERTSSIVTDALRALKLEACGYDVSLIEFTSLEHTAKNIMIRAVRTGRPDPAAEEEFRKLAEFWHVEPSIARLI